MTFARIMLVDGKAMLHLIADGGFVKTGSIELTPRSLIVLLNDGMKALVAIAPELLEEKK